VETIRGVVLMLTRRYAFREVAALVGAGACGRELTTRGGARVQQLCAYGQRMLDLDAEDLANADAADGATTDTSLAELEPEERVPDFLIERGRRCRARQSPKETPRAALSSTHPTTRLILEVMAAHWYRRNAVALVATVHLTSEFVPITAWQPFLGHGADPADLQVDPSFCGPLSRWGHLDDDECPHTRPQKSAASRSLRVYDEPPSGWKAYLRRQHSMVAHALRVCATTCKTPCTVMTSHPAEDRERLAEACRAAAAFAGSAIVRLRHSAPVGHGFGGPSPAEVIEAWQRSRQAIAKRGGLCESALTEDGFALPGLPSLFSAIAGTTLTPDTLVADTAAEIVRLLDPQDVVL
jgi:hypothetical protein